VVWRRHDSSVPIADLPTGLADNRFFVPRRCQLHPEQIIEYPDPEELSDELRHAVVYLGDDGYDYAFELSTAPGWKVGGWPGWTDSPSAARCDACGTDMRYLLTIDTVEHAGGRWQPEEETGLPTNPDYTEPTGIVVGRWTRVTQCVSSCS
jgi:hypothetical protein